MVFEMPYTSKTISLHHQVWEFLECQKKVYGSYNKALKALLIDKPKVSKRDKKKEEIK